MICSSCNGQKRHVAFFDGVKNGKRCGWQDWVNCQACGGTGEVTQERADELKRLSRFRRARVAAHMSLMDATSMLQAKGFALRDYVHLSHMEHGREPMLDGLGPEVYG